MANSGSAITPQPCDVREAQHARPKAETLAPVGIVGTCRSKCPSGNTFCVGWLEPPTRRQTPNYRKSMVSLSWRLGGLAAWRFELRSGDNASAPAYDASHVEARALALRVLGERLAQVLLDAGVDWRFEPAA